MDTKAISPSDEELIKVLARVVGVELHESEKGWMYWYNFGHGESLQVWDPLHDANQMERVEEALKQQGWEMIVGWSKATGSHWAELRNDTKAFWSNDGDKKRAFALAVYAMEQDKERHAR